MLLARLENVEFIWLQTELFFNKDWNSAFQVYWVKLCRHLSQMTQIITNVLGKAAENLRHKRSFPAKRRGLGEAAFLRPGDAVPHGCSTDEQFFTSQRLPWVPPGESRACRIHPRCRRSAVCHRLRRTQIPLPRPPPPRPPFPAPHARRCAKPATVGLTSGLWQPIPALRTWEAGGGEGGSRPPSLYGRPRFRCF